MLSDGLKGPFPEARAQAKSFGSVLAVRAVQPRIAVALGTPVLAVGLSGGVEEAHLRDWRLLDHRSNESSAISPARTRFTFCSPQHVVKNRSSYLFTGMATLTWATGRTGVD